jgi:hypothetical protein
MKTTVEIQNFRCRVLNAWELMLVTVQDSTINQMIPRQIHTWPLNFAAWRLNRLKISLMGWN